MFATEPISPHPTQIIFSQHSGVRGHFTGPNPWLPIEDTVMVGSARVVGAKEVEVVVMNSLTVNIHLGLVSVPDGGGD